MNHDEPMTFDEIKEADGITTSYQAHDFYRGDA